jgi:hypothetical protein
MERSMNNCTERVFQQILAETEQILAGKWKSDFPSLYQRNRKAANRKGLR